MATVHIEKTIAAPPDRVFDLISDHAAYSRFPGIQSSELVREGETERNGLGALRRIRSRPLRFVEEITGFDRPTRMDYLIREVNAPMRHDGGSMVLTERDGDTHVDWTSTWHFTVPLIGGLLGAISVWVVGRGFRRVLDEVERLAVEPVPVAA
jgi:uncharacterized protein YndB with AHSA1/START domain